MSTIGSTPDPLVVLTVEPPWSSFDVLHLLANLLHLSLGLDGKLREAKIARLRRHRVDLPLDFLKKKIDALADRVIGRGQIPQAAEVTAQPHDLFGDVASLRLEGRLLHDARL